MRTMLDFLEEAGDLLGSVWGNARAPEVRGYLKKHLPEWSEEDRESVLILASALAHWHAEGAREAIGRAERIAIDAAKTAKDLGRYRLREGDRRENERRAAIIDRHFGSTLRGETGDQSIEADEQGGAP